MKGSLRDSTRNYISKISIWKQLESKISRFNIDNISVHKIVFLEDKNK